MPHEEIDLSTPEGQAKAQELGLPLDGFKPVQQKKATKRKPRQEMSTKTKKPSTFTALCKAHGLTEPVSEYEFATEIGRKWRFDHCWPDIELALEIEGNVWASVNGKKSRHFHGQGILDDMEKYNWAAILGWRVLRCEPKDIESGKVFELLKAAFEC